MTSISGDIRDYYPNLPEWLDANFDEWHWATFDWDTSAGIGVRIGDKRKAIHCMGLGGPVDPEPFAATEEEVKEQLSAIIVSFS